VKEVSRLKSLEEEALVRQLQVESAAVREEKFKLVHANQKIREVLPRFLIFMS